MLGEMAERCRKEKLSDTERREMFEQPIKMIGIAAPQVERLCQQLRHLEKFIQDETDPTGDAMGLGKSG